MRIRIEIDGRVVLDTSITTLAPEADVAGLYSRDEQPPEELLREARARGAQNAGRASYIADAGTARTAAAAAAEHPVTTLAGPRTRRDAEAGRAVAAKAASRPRAAKSAARVSKRKRVK